jgi:P pilus assembly chaperone PapD
VAIPPVVLIRPHNRRLVVTTNTGQPPQAQDTFYYIVHNTARVARPALRQRILSKCAR